jgi:hypothetical protein
MLPAEADKRYSSPTVCFEPAVSGVALNVLMQESWDLHSLQINVINRCTEGPNHTAVLLDPVGAAPAESIYGMSWCHLGCLYSACTRSLP